MFVTKKPEIASPKEFSLAENVKRSVNVVAIETIMYEKHYNRLLLYISTLFDLQPANVRGVPVECLLTL